MHFVKLFMRMIVNITVVSCTRVCGDPKDRLHLIEMTVIVMMMCAIFTVEPIGMMNLFTEEKNSSGIFAVFELIESDMGLGS